MERVCRKIGVGLMVFMGVGLWGKTAFPLVFGWGETEVERKPAGMVFAQNPEESSGADSLASTKLETIAQQNRKSFKESEMRQKGVQEVSVIASELGFFPKTIFVSRDVPVRLYVTGASKSALCIMMDFFQVRKQVRSQKIEEITFTPDQPGRFRFYCPINGMEGMLVVRELYSAPTNDEESKNLSSNLESQ